MSAVLKWSVSVTSTQLFVLKERCMLTGTNSLMRDYAQHVCIRVHLVSCFSQEVVLKS